MTDIDCTDCYLAIQIGDGVRRALVRHFQGFIADRLDTRGIAMGAERSLDWIDRDAWRLAASVLGEVENELLGTLDEATLLPDPQHGAQTMVATAVDASVTTAERRYLADRLCGFERLAATIAET